VVGAINDQYRSLSGALRFLRTSRNIPLRRVHAQGRLRRSIVDAAQARIDPDFHRESGGTNTRFAVARVSNLGLG